jgi:hypothetical protein
MVKSYLTQGFHRGQSATWSKKVATSSSNGFGQLHSRSQKSYYRLKIFLVADFITDLNLSETLMNDKLKTANSAESERSLPASTRRGMLRAAAGLTGTVVFSSFVEPRSATAAKKLKTQEEVKYQPTPKGKQNCENCDLFIKPDKCKSVEGTVAAEGWCNIWIAY